jgi:hypothetical protein
MQTFSTAYEKKLKELLTTRIQERTEELATGRGVMDYGDFRWRVGHIRGLFDALEICDEARDEISKAEQGL